MAKKEQIDIVYTPRGELDNELVAAIDDILSAEREAKRLIAEAEQTVAELRAESGAKERELREKFNAEKIAARDKVISEAAARAEADAAKGLQAAVEKGEKLVEQKQSLINKQISKLYSELGGK